MKRWTVWIDVALAAAAAYGQNRRRSHARLMAQIVLLLLSVAALLTAMGLFIAAVYCSLIVLGPALAALLTGAGVLAVAVAAGIAGWRLAGASPKRKP